MNRKAQGATEYLIILAVVIIIALIVVGAMGGIPGIGSSGKIRASVSYWATADVAITTFAHSVAATKNMNITVKNNMMNNINSLTVTIGGFPQTCSLTSLAAGQSTKCWPTAAAAACAGGAGATYSYDVLIAYQDPETKRTSTFNGNGQKYEGKCTQ